jgi:hypothetical protein
MWATTLEIFDIRSNSSLKTGGEEEHREFFKLCSLIFAFLDNCITKQEGEHFDINTIYERIKELNNKHNIINVLQGIKVSIQHIDSKTKCDFLYWN